MRWRDLLRKHPGAVISGFHELLAKDEIICSCPITEQSRVSYQISGPYPRERKFFENCKLTTANNHTSSTLYVCAPTGSARVLSILLTGMNPKVNECFLH